MADPILSAKDLNRALLARQLLLARAPLDPLTALRRLFALQAQQPRGPFLGLLARLDKFTRGDLLDLINRRQVVRATLMRATLHLVTTADYLALRATLQPALDAAFTGRAGKQAPAGLAEALALARRYFAGGPRDFEALRERIEAEVGGDDVRVLAYGARLSLPLVQAPSGAAFGYETGGAFALAPARLLPDFDAVLLGHQDRTRVLPAAHAPKIANKNLQVPAIALVDGFVAGSWKLERKGRTATVAIQPFEQLPERERDALEREALDLATFAEPDARPAVRFAAALS